MKFKTKAGLFLCAGCVFLAGCASMIKYGVKLSKLHSVEDSIQKDSTTKQEIITLLGNPIEILRPDENQEILIYESESTRINPWSPVCKKKTARLTITFNSQGILQDYKLDELYTEYLPSYQQSQSQSTTAARHQMQQQNR